MLTAIRVLVRSGGWVALSLVLHIHIFAPVGILLIFLKLMYTADILLGSKFVKFNKNLATGAGVGEPREGYIY